LNDGPGLMERGVGLFARDAYNALDDVQQGFIGLDGRVEDVAVADGSFQHGLRDIA
jgi:hypothetical protein